MIRNVNATKSKSKMCVTPKTKILASKILVIVITLQDNAIRRNVQTFKLGSVRALLIRRRVTSTKTINVKGLLNVKTSFIYPNRKIAINSISMVVCALLSTTIVSVPQI